MGYVAQFFGILTLLAFLTAGQARAGIVYTNLAENTGSYNYYVSSSDTLWGYTGLGFSFVATGSGSAVSANLMLYYTYSSSSIKVLLLSDNGGTPGSSTLAEGNTAALAPRFDPPSGMTDVTLSSYSPLTTGLTYWLVVLPGPSTTYANWVVTSDLGTYAYYGGDHPTAPDALYGSGIAAFQINSGPTVPEPATGLVFLGGVLLIAARQFSRRQAES